jgi:hypothetical protein
VETLDINVATSSRSSPGPFDAHVPLRATFGVLLLLRLLFAPLMLHSVPAETVHPTESQVKAAYLYNFGKFVRWPSDKEVSRNSLEICILGQDPFGPVLDATVAGESIDGKGITVKRISKVQDAPQCGILFISLSEGDHLAPILAAAQHSGTLTVSDIPRFAEQGGIIGFVIKQDKIRFEVNRGAAALSHLTLSSELLKVASKVIEPTEARH